MVSFGMLKKVIWLALLILVNAVHCGKGLAADRNHRRSVSEPTVTEVGDANKEDVEATPLQNASRLQGSVAMHGSGNHSREAEPEREASGKLLDLTVANQSLSTIHSHGGANISVSKSNVTKTAVNLNVSSTEHALNNSTGSSTSDSVDSLNNSQAENIVHTTLCANGSVERETMRVEVEFASTVLENGLYYFTSFYNDSTVMQ